jgi:glycosyltransferase involved in cell wall biosynthesis
MPKPRLGLAMITLNEEMHIPATLPQFYHVVDDIVVVDGGSSDGTVNWCERLGARVIHHPFENDFAAQKNLAIEALDTEWIYLHDPDERLEPTLLELLPLLMDEKEGQHLLKGANILPTKPTGFDCFGIARRNYIDGLQTEIYPDYQYRLFRNYCRFDKPVHEEIINFEDRTELDYTNNSLEKPARFNILHYKSGAKQDKQNAMYRKIERTLSDEHE